MAKTKTYFVCQQCGAEHLQWGGQCSQCNAWNTLTSETREETKSSTRRGYANDAGSEVCVLSEVATQTIERMPTGLNELDHVLGGGLVNGSAVLIGGDPGIGKSTMLLQISISLSREQKALYVTGEESLQQIALRARRLGLPQDHLNMLAETCVERILAIAKKEKPTILVIDSIQTMFTELFSSSPGSVSQVRESAARLVQYAKSSGTILLLVGHVTKEGTLAGPRVLEHMVDTVLYFEGQTDTRYRALRAVKNRFGSVNELGVFAMTDKGLREVNNPSAIFLSAYQGSAPGSVVMVTWGGTRPLLVEVQALVDESHLSNPRRVTVGLDGNRLSMLLAVMHRHAGIATFGQDIFVNVVGGMRISETAADLSLAMAVLSSLRNESLPPELIIFGEIGLSGEIRPIQSGQERLREASKHGFKRAIVPAGNAPKKEFEGMQIHPVKHLREALEVVFA